MGDERCVDPDLSSAHSAGRSNDEVLACCFLRCGVLSLGVEGDECLHSRVEAALGLLEVGIHGGHPTGRRFTWAPSGLSTGADEGVQEWARAAIAQLGIPF